MPALPEDLRGLRGPTDVLKKLTSPGIERPGGLVPVQVRLPSAEDMLGMDAGSLIDLLQRYGIFQNWEQMKAQDSGRAARLMEANFQIFQQQIEEIAENSLVQAARRVQERYTTSIAVNGDENQLLIRIPEDWDADRLCDNCADLAGTIGTYAEHDAAGLPGPSSCLGGNSCRCTLVAASDEVI